MFVRINRAAGRGMNAALWFLLNTVLPDEKKGCWVSRLFHHSISLSSMSKFAYTFWTSSLSSIAS